MKFRIAGALVISLFLMKSLNGQDKAYIKDTARSKDSYKTPKYSRDGYVAINGGLGMPTGSYSTNSCASSGSIFSITAAFPGIISHCGFAFKFDYGTNSLNKAQFSGTLNNDTGVTNLSYSVADNVQKYSYKTLLGGLYLTYPGKYVTIDGRILAGIMKASVPAIAYTINDSISGKSGTVYQGETSSFALALDFGIEVRYQFKPKFCVILNADYLHSVPTFLSVVTGSEITSTGTIISAPGRQVMGGDQPFDLYTISIGVGYTISAQKAAPLKPTHLD